MLPQRIQRTRSEVNKIFQSLIVYVCVCANATHTDTNADEQTEKERGRMRGNVYRGTYTVAPPGRGPEDGPVLVVERQQEGGGRGRVVCRIRGGGATEKEPRERRTESRAWNAAQRVREGICVFMWNTAAAQSEPMTTRCVCADALFDCAGPTMQQDHHELQRREDDNLCDAHRQFSCPPSSSPWLHSRGSTHTLHSIRC